MNVKQLSSSGKPYIYVFVGQDEEVDKQRIAREYGNMPIVIIRNGQKPFTDTIVNILQYITDNPLTPN